LSISYSLIARQGGRIEVESETGQGARFAIHQPAPMILKNANAGPTAPRLREWRTRKLGWPDDPSSR
jgi:hypothetical protein